MESRPWKLGLDLSVNDDLLDRITFDDLITAVRCNCILIDSFSVKAELEAMLASRKLEMDYLLENNMDEIIASASEGQELN